MKLSQALCISLTLLICFSSTLSLAMERVIDVRAENNLEERLLSDDDMQVQISLADRLKSKHTQFFKQASEVKKLNCSKICNPRMVKNFFKKYYYFLITLTVLLTTLYLVDPMESIWTDSSVRSIFYVWFVLISLIWINVFFIFRSRSPMNKIDSQDQITNKDLFLVDLNSSLCCIKQLIVYAAQKNKLEVVKKLLTRWDCVPDVSSLCDSTTALGHAYEHKNIEMIKCLLKHPEFVNFDADSFITKSVTELKTDDEIIELLFDKGGKIKVEDLGEIISYTSDYFVKFLVDLGLDWNTKDIKDTPLFMHLLLRKRRMLFIDWLLEKNIDFSVADADGKTIFDYLNVRPNIEHADLLNEKLKLEKYKNEIYKIIYKHIKGKIEYKWIGATTICEYLFGEKPREA